MKKQASIVCAMAVVFGLAAGRALAVDNTGTGGTITYTDASGSNGVASPPYVGGYVIHTFTSSGTLAIPVAVTADVLVVAGGGGGAGFAGGGGAGGLIYSNNFAVSSGDTTVTVGAGGAGGATNLRGAQGANSQFGTLIADGGGGGAARDAADGRTGSSGGSGGGGAPASGIGGANTAGQGNPGGNGSSGYGGGGGGGAQAAGAAGSGSNGGKGGDGLPFSISGMSVYYGGGGGAGTYGGLVGAGGNGGGGVGSVTGTGGNSTPPNRGGGGGGGAWTYGGGAGGFGIVIVRYPYDPGATLLVSLNSPTNDQIFSSTASVSATAVFLSGTPPYTVNFYLDSNPTPVSTTPNATSPLTVNLGVLSVGSHTIEARVTDSTPTTVSSGTPVPFSVETDIIAPTPNPMTFAVNPAVLSSTSISMTATTATDAYSPPVEYYFENTTVSGHNSGWISSPAWTNTGLTECTTYGYRVKARDSATPPNETAFSAVVSVALLNVIGIDFNVGGSATYSGQPDNAAGLQLPVQFNAWNGFTVAATAGPQSITTTQGPTFTINPAGGGPGFVVLNQISLPTVNNLRGDIIAINNNPTPVPWQLTGLVPNGKYSLIFFQLKAYTGAYTTIDGVGVGSTEPTEKDYDFTDIVADGTGRISGAFLAPTSAWYTWAGLQFAKVADPLPRGTLFIFR